MRIIAGQWRGRRLKALSGRQTRPTLDRVKEALFDMIGPYFSGGLTLDAFAGSGALGLEALSRGKERAVFIERDPRAAAVLWENIRALGAESRAVVVVHDAVRAAGRLVRRGVAADLAFFDPPYEFPDSALVELLGVYAAAGVFRSEAVICVERGGPFMGPSDARFQLWKARSFGTAHVVIFRYRG